MQLKSIITSALSALLRKVFVIGSLCVICSAALPAQTHTSVPLESRVYYILEQAEVKGLCSPLSGVRPYTRNIVLGAINEILNSEHSGRLNSTEREILEQYRAAFLKPKSGIDWQRGGFYGETTIGKNDTLISANLGAGIDIEGSAGIYPSFDERYFGTETWVRLFLNGDIGKAVSYQVSAEGGLARTPRAYRGSYNTYYDGFQDDGEFQNRLLPVYSEPLTHFPYTYKKRWDGSVYFLNNLSSFESWPDSLAGGYNLESELTAVFFDSKLITRLGRLSHEWGSAALGSSMAMNKSARPFLGIEAEFNPFSWFGIASITGILEYNNAEGIKNSATNFQNAFSTTILQFKFKNYIFLDVGEGVIWPKRFELGYISPITSSIFYQNNIGDFDNMSMFINLKAQYPGLGAVWFSFFGDEVNWTSGNIFELDRTMMALQAGLTAPLPFLAFSSIKISYSVVNPYCYTHNRNYNPWYGDKVPMETSYTNNGASLGYYLPPNSDELLVQFKTMPAKGIAAHLQYQMIRHGADFGPDAVDGSSLWSELDPNDRNTNPVLKRFFLHDGAYEWMHIVKIGAEWNLPKLPFALFCEAGTVISYFTSIEPGKANSGQSYSYSIVDTPDYPKSTSFIASFGIKIFPAR